jgi:hypothetical protein
MGSLQLSGTNALDDAVMLVFRMHSQIAKRDPPVFHRPEIRFIQARQESMRHLFGSGLYHSLAAARQQGYLSEREARDLVLGGSKR